MLDLDPEAPIVSLTLGAARPLHLRDDIFKPTVQYELSFEPGAVFILGPRTNQAFHHSIPRVERSASVGPRVSLTFRRAHLQGRRGADPRPGDRYPSANWPTEINGFHRLDDALDRPTAG